jgi:hypothetical protein
VGRAKRDDLNILDDFLGLPENVEWRNATMNLKNYSLALAMGGALLFAPGLAFADARLAQAAAHMVDAVMQGKILHDATMLAMQASLALEDAQGIQKEKPNAHVAEAIVHIKAAIDEGRANHLDAALKHSEEAVTHLKEAAK